MQNLELSGFPGQGVEPARILRELQVSAVWPTNDPSNPRDIARPVAARFVGVRAASDSFTRGIEADLRETILEILGLPDAQCFLTGSGSESNLLALFSARQAAPPHRRKLLGSETLHGSVHKCAALLEVALELVAVDRDRRVSAASLRDALTDQVFAIVASAPNWESGVWDPLNDIGTLAAEKQVSFHVDACIGGFLLPFLPPSLGLTALPRGASSVAVDLHKFGYAPFSLSAVCFAAAAAAPERIESLAGDRPFWPIAAAWAVTKMLGHAGYQRLALALLARRAQICALLARRDVGTAGDPHSPIVRILPSAGCSLDALQSRFARVGVPHEVCASAGHIRFRVDPLLAEADFAQQLSAFERL